MCTVSGFYTSAGLTALAADPLAGVDCGEAEVLVKLDGDWSCAQAPNYEVIEDANLGRPRTHTTPPLPCRRWVGRRVVRGRSRTVWVRWRQRIMLMIRSIECRPMRSVRAICSTGSIGSGCSFMPPQSALVCCVTGRRLLASVLGVNRWCQRSLSVVCGWWRPINRRGRRVRGRTRVSIPSRFGSCCDQRFVRRSVSIVLCRFVPLI